MPELNTYAPELEVRTRDCNLRNTVIFTSQSMRDRLINSVKIHPELNIEWHDFEELTSKNEA